MSKQKKQIKYLLDICILTSGCVDLFEKCVNAIIEQGNICSNRIYVFNNSSPAETISKYEEIYKRLPQNAKIIRHTGKMLGFPAAANVLMNAGMSPLILLVTDDVIMHQGSINALVMRMDDPAIGICGMKLLFPEDSTDKNRPAGKVQHVGHSMSIRGEVKHIFIGWSSDNPRCNQSRECFSVTGAAFIVRRILFSKVKGFYEGYGKGTFEDVELCLSIRKLGARVFIDTNAVGTHYVGSTATMLNKPFPLQMNTILFQQRNQPMFVWDEWDIF